MRRVVFGLVLTLLLLTFQASAKDFGAGVGEGRVMKVSEILEKPGAHVGKNLIVEGIIVDVCRARGCWMDLAGDKPGQKLKIKVEDGVIVFPLEARGKKAKVQGILEELKFSREEALEAARHHAYETGLPVDPSKVKEGVQYRIRATGAVIP